MSKIYITNTNKPAAHARAVNILTEAGYTIGNSDENNEGINATDRAARIRHAVRQLSSCDAIYLLDGWRNSVAANIELHVAMLLNLAVYSEMLWPEPDEILPKRDVIDQSIYDCRMARYAGGAR